MYFEGAILSIIFIPFVGDRAFAQIRKRIDERGLDCELEVDGGVGPATRDACVEAGANVLVAGSAVYGAADIPARIQELRG